MTRVWSNLIQWCPGCGDATPSRACPACGAQVCAECANHGAAECEPGFWAAVGAVTAGLMLADLMAHPASTNTLDTPCGATDGLSSPDGPFGRCNLPAGHDTDWHQEWRGEHLWAEWRGPHPGKRCGICGKDGREH